MTPTQAARRSLDDFPEIMSVKDIAEWLGLSVSRAHALDAAGAFDFSACRPRIGRKSFDRDRLRDWKEGNLAGLRGRKAARR